MSLFEVIGNGELGGKGEWTRKAIEAGLKFPDTFVISTEVFDSAKFIWEDEELLDGDSGLGNKFDSELERVLRYFADKPVAIRSSVTVEDGYAATCAGMFPTKFTRFRQYPETLDGFKRQLFWEFFCSIFGEDQKAYMEKHNLQQPKVAVEVQKLVGSYVKPMPPRFPEGGMAPRLAGYFNTMYPAKHILGIVRGMGTGAVGRIKSPTFHFSPQGDLIEFMDKQSSFDFFCYWTKVLKSMEMDSGNPVLVAMNRASGLDLTINHNYAESIFKALGAVEGHLRQRFDFGSEFGSDIEWAVENNIDEITYLQFRPVKRRKGSLTFPDVPSLIQPYSMVGMGRKDITKVVDMSENRYVHGLSGYEKLRQFNENNKGYLLIAPRGTFYTGTMVGSCTEIPYSAFYNAGLILCPEKEGFFGSGADHFALICNDDDIFYIDCCFKGENPLKLKGDIQIDDENLFVYERELTAIVNANLGKATLFENPGFKI